MDNIKTPNMEVTGLDELSKKLDRLQAHDSQMEQRITKIIREAIKAARSMVTCSSDLTMKIVRITANITARILFFITDSPYFLQIYYF